jgi:hypothetical protein
MQWRVIERDGGRPSGREAAPVMVGGQRRDSDGGGPPGSFGRCSSTDGEEAEFLFQRRWRRWAEDGSGGPRAARDERRRPGAAKTNTTLILLCKDPIGEELEV